MKESVVELIKCVNKRFNDNLKAEFKIKEIPIKLKHIDLFMILYECGEKIEFKNLVKIWGISKSTVSETITRYVKLDLLKKENTTTDKRLVYISLTEKGNDYADKINGITHEFSTEINGLLGEDKDNLKNILKEIIKSDI
ncbi:MarR family winged helix-turn-helix transcriptional regulator [Fusobacteria bacterium ZRK30]|nr:MarR family winged helix-turn-helix transcriptional regulator [Fusobacteria bacterium ZRK30]